MRAEPAAPAAEASRCFWHHPGRNRNWRLLGGHIDKPDELARFLAFVLDLLVSDHDEVARFANLVMRELGDRHVEHRKRRMRTMLGPPLPIGQSRDSAGSPRSAPSGR